MIKSFHRLCSGPTLLFIMVALIGAAQALWSKFELVSIENSKSGIFNTDLKVESYSKTICTMRGTFELIADINDDYEMEVNVYISQKNDDKYKALPYKIPREELCKSLESSHWKSLERDLMKFSNAPTRVKDEKYCFTAKKAIYELRDFPIDTKIFPKILEAGIYKVELKFYKKGSSDASSALIFKCKFS